MRIKLIAILSIVLISISIMFCACSGPVFPPIEEGVFLYDGYDIVHDKSRYAKLIITPIDENEFNQADGVNVIKDVSKERKNDYYRVELWYGESQDNCEKAEYVNLSSTKNPHERGDYYDVNGSWVQICKKDGEVYYNVCYVYDLEKYYSFEVDLKRG